MMENRMRGKKRRGSGGGGDGGRGGCLLEIRIPCIPVTVPVISILFFVFSEFFLLSSFDHSYALRFNYFRFLCSAVTFTSESQDWNLF